MTYNYTHFGLKNYDLEHFSGPKVGDKASDFEAIALDGKKIRLSDFLGKIVVLESGSLTCPASVGTTKQMQKLVKKYTDVIFLFLYVREEHPGERTPKHHSFDEKFACARKFQQEEHDNRLIIVDDLEGSIHKQYGLFPNFVYVIDPEGYVAFRRPWNIPERLDETLKAMKERGVKRFPETYELPLLRNVGFRAIRRAGWRALWDLLLNFPMGLWIRYKLGRLQK